MAAKISVIKELEELYKKSGNGVYVLYGRENSEKERLIRSFLNGKKFFYYRARQASAETQLGLMGKEVGRQFSTAIHKYQYEEFFKRVRSGDPSKLVVVIDEFEHIVKKDDGFLHAVEKLKAKRLYPGPVLILLCSSSIVWAERELSRYLKEKPKLLDGKVKIGDLNFLEVVRSFPSYQVSDCIKVYGIIGGVAGYVNCWNDKSDIKTNVCKNILSQTGPLNSAAEDVIRSELRELSVYETILYYIAAGNDKLNELYKETGYPRAKISVYLKNLAAFDLIQKVVSFETGGWENAKKGVYRIKDHYVNFWFRFIYPHLSDLYLMQPEEFYDTYIAPGLDDYLGRYFIEVCMEYVGLMNMVGKLPMQIRKMGTWIGKEGNIDIIAQNAVRENIVGSCNWSEPEFTMEMCETLSANMQKAKIKAKYYFLFSARGFSAELVKKAKEDKSILLIDMNEL